MFQLRPLSRFCVAAERIGDMRSAFKVLSQIAPDFTHVQLTTIVRFFMLYEASLLKEKLYKGVNNETK